MCRFTSFAITRSPQLYLTRSNDELVGFRSLNSVPDVPYMTCGVMWSNVLVKVPNVLMTGVGPDA